MRMRRWLGGSCLICAWLLCVHASAQAVRASDTGGSDGMSGLETSDGEGEAATQAASSHDTPSPGSAVAVDSDAPLPSAALDPATSLSRDTLAPGPDATVSVDVVDAVEVGAVGGARTDASAEPAGPLWAWVAGGVAVVLGVVIAGALISAAESPRDTPPLEGNVGPAIQTLGRP